MIAWEYQCSELPVWNKETSKTPIILNVTSGMRYISICVDYVKVIVS